MSLPEVTSFAVSGAAAKALSTLATNPISTSTTTHTPDRPLAAAGDGLVFFLIYGASARVRHNDAQTSTRRAAAEAFLTGTVSAACARLITSVFSRPRSQTGAPEAMPAWFSWSALEDDLVLALDPALTFCLHEVLGRFLSRQLHGGAAAVDGRASNVSRSIGHVRIVATTFVLAAISKAVAATVTYPLHTAVEQRYRTWQAGLARAAAAAAAASESHPGAGGPPGDAAPSQNLSSARQLDSGSSRILSILWRIAKTDGVLALYAGWLRTVSKAALGHGLTMAGQRILYGLVLRLTYAVAGALAARSPDSQSGQRHRLFSETREVEEVESRAPAPAVPAAAAAAPPAPLTSPTPLAAEAARDEFAEATEKTTKAIENWLESTTAASETTHNDAVRDRDMHQEIPTPAPPTRSVVSRQQQVSTRSVAPPRPDSEAPPLVQRETTTTRTEITRPSEQPPSDAPFPAREGVRGLPWPQEDDRTVISAATRSRVSVSRESEPLMPAAPRQSSTALARRGPPSLPSLPERGERHFSTSEYAAENNINDDDGEGTVILNFQTRSRRTVR